MFTHTCTHCHGFLSSYTQLVHNTWMDRRGKACADIPLTNTDHRVHSVKALEGHIELQTTSYKTAFAHTARAIDDESTATGTTLPAMDVSLQAWLFVAGATVLEFLVWGYGFAFGVLQEYYASPGSPFHNSSTLAVSSIGSVGVGIQYMSGIFLEPLYKAYPQHIRSSMWACLLISVGAFVLSSWATKVWQLILLQGVIFGVASAGLYFPVIVWLSEWFFHRRSTAAGIIFGGSSGGGVILPFMFRFLLDKLGFPNAMRVWAAFFFLLGAVVIPTVRTRVPVNAARQQLYPTSLQIPDFSYLCTAQYCMFAVTVVIQRMAYTPITTLLPSYAKAFPHVTNLQSTATLALLNSAGIIGLVIAGYSSDRTKYWKVMAVSGSAAALAIALVLGFAQNINRIYAFGICFGIAGGGYASLWTAAAKSIKEESSGTVFLTFSFLAGVGTVMGPLIAGALRTTDEKISTYGTHGFKDVIICITSLLVFVGMMGIGIAVQQHKLFARG